MRIGRNIVFVVSMVLANVVLTPSNCSAEQVDANILNHMDFALNLGTDGLGVDLMMPASDWVRIRLGFVYMPRFEKTLTFTAQVGDTYDADKMAQMTKLMKDLTGYEVDDKIDMTATPTFWNGKVLVDVFPFRKKRWFFTAGVYVGPTTVAKAYNKTEEMPTLMAMTMYNSIYDKVKNEEPIIEEYGGLELPPQINEKILNMGRMSMPIGTFSHDVVNDAGLVMHRQGDTYRMVPGADGMVKAEAIANMVRPYVGFGYRVPISKDERTQFAFNAGVLCWGNVKLVTHDGVDMVRDLENVNGQIKKYVDLAGGAKVYPILNITLSQRLF